MTVRSAPSIAPEMVKHSRNIAAFRLVTPSLRNEEEEPLDVAMTEIRPEATACLTGTPSNTRKGIVTLAPPRPVRDPRRPARVETRTTSSTPTKVPLACGVWIRINGIHSRGWGFGQKYPSSLPRRKIRIRKIPMAIPPTLTLLLPVWMYLKACTK